jgi:hypothetical protein
MVSRLLLVAGCVFASASFGFLLRAASAESGIKFPHGVHVESGLECDLCHEAATTSQRGSDLLLPQKPACADCHDVEDTATCGTCHRNADEPSGYGTRVAVAQNFPHELHLKQNMDCATCHLGESKAEPTLPDKASCRACHATASQQSDCRLCHAAGEELVPASHGAQFLQQHAIEASWNQARCALCHTQTDCQECHGGDNVRPRSHPLNYAFDHALDARSKEMTCYACHQSEYCSSCHRAQRIRPSNHSQADWVSFSGGGRHAEEGRFDMESCTACHDAGSTAPTCTPCHGE